MNAGFWRALVISGAVLLAGCDDSNSKLPAPLRSPWSNYVSCLKEGKAEKVLSDDSVKGYCAWKYETELPSSLEVDGKAALIMCSPEANFSPDNLSLPRTCLGLAGTLDNNSKAYVITGLDVSYTNKETKKSETKTVQSLWIEPGSSSDFQFILAHEWHSKNFDSVRTDFGWNITGLRGFQISL